MKDLITEARELCADAQLEAALLELKTMSGWLNKVVYHKLGIRWSFDNSNLIHWIVVFMRLLPELCDALEKAHETKNEELNKAHDAGFYAGQKYALREKQERSGCEFCQQGEEMAYGQDSMKRTAYIYLDGNLLVADLYSESMAVAVCYCPMCGKRLEEHHEAD